MNLNCNSNTTAATITNVVLPIMRKVQVKKIQVKQLKKL